MTNRPARRPPPILVWILLGLGFLVGYWIHRHLNLELSLEGLREWVRSWGILAPVLFVAILSFRQFLLLPSLLVLSVGGLCFGVFWGTILGAIGLIFSGIVSFGLGRGLGGDRWRTKFQEGYPKLEHRLEQWGPLVVLAVMVYPGGPMTPVFWAAGCSTMRFGPYLIAVISGAMVRAFAYAFFGATLVDGITPGFIIFVAILTLLLLLPLSSPRFRKKMVGWWE